MLLLEFEPVNPVYNSGWPEPYIKGIYSVHAVFLAGKSPYIGSYTVQIYGSGQPYVQPNIRFALYLYSEIRHI
jgi:hypothetical protein